MKKILLNFQDDFYFKIKKDSENENLNLSKYIRMNLKEKIENKISKDILKKMFELNVEKEKIFEILKDLNINMCYINNMLIECLPNEEKKFINNLILLIKFIGK